MKNRDENINQLCSRCRNTCKQTTETKIIVCPMFTEKKNELKYVLKSEPPKGKKNVSAAKRKGTRLNSGRNLILKGATPR